MERLFLCIFGVMDIEISFRFADHVHSFFVESETPILVGDIIDLESFDHLIDADEESYKEIIKSTWIVKYRQWKLKNDDKLYLNVVLFAG